ncbi:TIGR03435 family protein [Terriglobus albidus]|uniref:TIGR03435 family protein n=1 Tax=Terriglobus albidus TaxID=1592106 RepID=UPI0021DF8AE9|nr:TIGR03435 family protein [Terriglobus albidus]
MAAHVSIAMHRLLTVAVLGGALAAHGQSLPQTGQQKHSFEVVSVKPSAAANDSTNVDTTPYRVHCENVLVRQLLMMAFAIRSESQIESMPDWAKSERFNIDAKVDEETAAAMKGLSRDERQRWQQEMMQSLLEDRFHLKFHWDKKELPVYILTVARNGARNGSKLKATVPPPSGTDRNAKPRDSGTSFSTNNGHMVVANGSMEMFANQLSHMTEMDSRVVLDRTNLPGRFDWTLDWSPERQQNSFRGADGGNPAPAADTSKPTLFTALQEQLGLKVEQDKAPVDLLVIDDLERPTEN